MHLVIYFCGTGNPGDTFKNGYNYLQGDANVSTVFVQGCENSQVCDSALFPDLPGFARRFSENLFQNQDSELRLNGLTSGALENLRIGIIADRTRLTNSGEPIESITLCGYSRGAVTCFEVAKQLNKIAPGIPVDIVADQPVPGNYYQGPGTNARSVADCSKLKNLRNVSVILGAYTGAHQAGDIESVDRIHRGFFSQIVPKLPRKATRDLIVIPREHHNQGRHNDPRGEEHMHMQLATYLNKQGLVEEGAVEEKTAMARAQYTQSWNKSPTLFPEEKQLQGIFGLSRKEAYQHVDKLHPTPGLRKGMTWTRGGSLIDWWKEQETKASRFSTALTNHLEATLQKTNINNRESLKQLFTEADKWLILKNGQRTSRYHQVEALRNNIYYHLMNDMHVPRQDLSIINRNNLAETNYFLKHWTKESKAASYFKTDATRTLDDAFEVHAKSPQSFENDEQLLRALDTWLYGKAESTSSRYDLVLQMREHLEEMMNNTYTAQQEQGITLN